MSDIERAKIDLLFIQFFSPFCKYLAPKLHWSAIKFWSTLVHTLHISSKIGNLRINVIPAVRTFHT